MRGEGLIKESEGHNLNSKVVGHESTLNVQGQQDLKTKTTSDFTSKHNALQRQDRQTDASNGK